MPVFTIKKSRIYSKRHLSLRNSPANQAGLLATLPDSVGYLDLHSVATNSSYIEYIVFVYILLSNDLTATNYRICLLYTSPPNKRK